MAALGGHPTAFSDTCMLPHMDLGIATTNTMAYASQGLLCTKSRWSLLLALGVKQSRHVCLAPLLKVGTETLNYKAPFQAVNYVSV